MNLNRLFHLSENPDIKVFNPRPSPSHFENIHGDVVFAINEMLLHNYLLPRDCPRVTYYLDENTTPEDKQKFFRLSTADFIIAIESDWFRKIKETALYCYELPAETFLELDKTAGYFISYQRVAPVSIRKIDDIFEELFRRNIELRFLPTLWNLAEEVSKSTLGFSLIRMRNAKQEKTVAN